MTTGLDNSASPGEEMRILVAVRDPLQENQVSHRGGRACGRGGQARTWLAWRCGARLSKGGGQPPPERTRSVATSAWLSSARPRPQATLCVHRARVLAPGCHPHPNALDLPAWSPSVSPPTRSRPCTTNAGELELGYDEIKTEMLDREEAIRSKRSSAVTQELWGIFVAYNLVRLEMQRVADDAGVEPTRISFVAVLRLICEWLWGAVATLGAIPSPTEPPCQTEDPDPAAATPRLQLP